MAAEHTVPRWIGVAALSCMVALALALIAAGILVLSHENEPMQPLADFADYLPGRTLPSSVVCESPQLYYYGTTGSDFFCRLPPSLPCRYVYVAGRGRTVKTLMLYWCTLTLGDLLAFKGRPERVMHYRQKSSYYWPDGSYVMVRTERMNLLAPIYLGSLRGE